MIHIKVVLYLPNNLQLPITITSGPSLTCCNVSAVQFCSVIAFYTIVHVNHSLVLCCMSLDSSPINFYI